MGLFHDILFEANPAQFEKDLKDAYGMGFRDGRLCPADLRPCTAFDRPALFHCWVVEEKGLLNIDTILRHDHPSIERMRADFHDKGIIPPCCSLEKLRETRAVVEWPDGSVSTVPLDVVQFTDRED